MFEIRIICDPADTDRITAALDTTFQTGTVTAEPARDGKRTRLYTRADHRTDQGSWPTPEAAYAFAPSIVREITWTAQTAREVTSGNTVGREYWLRKAALLDRIALHDEQAEVSGDAEQAATEAARRFVDYDRDNNGGHPDGPCRAVYPRAAAQSRGYVRQEYAHWAKNQ
ncbi:hypothetical protein [Streptomyces reticuliscabiei]|uniref:hypothetical protein n=1 Tax=Streptomyces reticuliscabiei TaxID=146821 RepID=UPI00073F86B9|nr:hypothetical protein [Streptomyces reticuliscabiei]GAQ73823.1 hypothetical protein T45_05587 [Streptomyces turgidiscabies]